MTAVGDQELLFSHSFERPEDSSVVSVLDIAAICRLPGTPLLRDSSSWVSRSDRARWEFRRRGRQVTTPPLNWGRPVRWVVRCC